MMRRKVHSLWHSIENLHEVLRARADSINISRLQIDRHANFPDGYSSKVLSPQPTKKLSIEGICKLAPALGLDLALVENETYLLRIRSRSPPRDSSHAKHAGTVHIVFSKRHMLKNSKKGGQNSRKYVSKRRATMLARKAANTHWDRVRKERGNT
jgi:hypothetical protein